MVTVYCPMLGSGVGWGLSWCLMAVGGGSRLPLVGSGRSGGLLVVAWIVWRGCAACPSVWGGGVCYVGPLPPTESARGVERTRGPTSTDIARMGV